MSNDRIIIKCRHCGLTYLFAKYYPSNYGMWYPECVEDFVDRHMSCLPNIGGHDLQGDRCFDLFTESDERYNELIKHENCEYCDARDSQ